jgi:maltose alpha-D-glucosyltransferase/alpha-amylase
LSKEVTPEIPESTQWFTFLRCHDELSLELVYVSEEDRKYIHDNYCHQPKWDFRLGQGVAARLSELMMRDPQRIGLAYSVMLSLPGTPIIYYGDEFGKLNDEKYYAEQIKLTGKDDTRFLVRGKVDWEKLETEFKNPESLATLVYKKVKKLVTVRNQFKAFGRGSIEWVDVYGSNNKIVQEVLTYRRVFENEDIIVLQNLSNKEQWIHTNHLKKSGLIDMLGTNILFGKEPGHLMLNPLEYLWIDLSE